MMTSDDDEKPQKTNETADNHIASNHTVTADKWQPHTQRPHRWQAHGWQPHRWTDLNWFTPCVEFKSHAMIWLPYSVSTRKHLSINKHAYLKRQSLESWESKYQVSRIPHPFLPKTTRIRHSTRHRADTAPGAKIPNKKKTTKKHTPKKQTNHQLGNDFFGLLWSWPQPFFYQ